MNIHLSRKMDRLLTIAWMLLSLVTILIMGSLLTGQAFNLALYEDGSFSGCLPWAACAIQTITVIYP